MTRPILRRVLPALIPTALLLLQSCITTDKTLGTKYIPENQDVTILTDEIDLPVELKAVDSLQTSISSTILIGSITTDTFGTLRLSGACSVTPAGDSIEWGDNPVLNSVSLECLVSAKQYLDDDQVCIPQNIRAYQLNTELDTNKIFNNSVSRKDCNPKSITKGNCVYLGGDTIKMNLTKEFGEQFFKYDMETLDSAELFTRMFHGIFFEVDDIEKGTTGGRINCLDLSSSYIDLAFTSTNWEGERRDTTVSFILGDYTSVVSIDAESKCMATEYPENALYIEGFTGVKPYVNGAKLKKVMSKWAAGKNLDLSNILIVKAAFEFPYEYSGDYTDYDPYPTNLYLCQRTPASSGDYLIYSPIDEIYDDNLSDGSINRSLDKYSADGALYLQDLIKKDDSELDTTDDIWMMQTYSYTASSSSTTYYYVDCNNYYAGRVNGTKAERHPKIKLSYTVLK